MNATSVIFATKQRFSWKGLVCWLCYAGLGWMLAACAVLQQRGHDDVPQRVRFQPYGRIPVIEAKLNGKPAFFIVDTGASVSILNEQAARHFGFRIAAEGMYDAVEVTGFNGTSTMHHAGRCILEIGDLQIRSLRFKSRDMSDFSSVFFDQERIRLAGILGADMLTQYNMTIDFGTKTLVFKATPVSK